MYKPTILVYKCDVFLIWKLKNTLGVILENNDDCDSSGVVVEIYMAMTITGLLITVAGILKECWWYWLRY
jgi:hypothetical protein